MNVMTSDKSETFPSSRLRYGVLFVFIAGFAVLGWITGRIYKVAPPIPEQVTNELGAILFTGHDIREGQQVFLKYGLMQNGSIWGHGAYLGPDFTAEYLHTLVMGTSAFLAEQHFGQPFADVASEQRGMLKGAVRDLLGKNRYDSTDGVLVFTRPEESCYREQIAYWANYFIDPAQNWGLPPKTIKEPEALRQLTAFFAWTAWAATAQIPGTKHSYTGNFPYDPELGNGPSADAVLWSALSLIALLGGIAAILFAFGRFKNMGWHGRDRHVHPALLDTPMLPSQRATLKFFAAVALLFLLQTLLGGATAHYRSAPGSFYGFDLSTILPSNLTRTWHLQLAIFWIATAYVGGGLFLASALGGREPRGQKVGINLLFAALMVVIFGSLAGELLGLRQFFGRAWFWLGHQGWEYLELGRLWQLLLVIGFALWAVLLVRGVGAVRKDPRQCEMALLFLGAAFTIPIFYLPAFMFGQATHFTIVDTWRFWIIHLWVEGFFELFATVMVATIFFKLDMVSRRTATRVIYLDAILFLGGGIIGTGHHWYWTGQTTFSMALSAVFSALEVVPLVLLALEAGDFVRLSRQECDICHKPMNLPHKWTFYFLMSVGVWNFIGAGVFGFLINLPVVSYYEAGTNLTANHGHAALMGVFGLLAVAMLVFVLRQMATERDWVHIEKFVRVSFWGLNIGLAGIVLLSLFPTGIMQLHDVITNGYWHARSAAFQTQPSIVFLSWLRMPADVIFIMFGALPLLTATVLTCRSVRRR